MSGERAGNEMSPPLETTWPRNISHHPPVHAGSMGCFTILLEPQCPEACQCTVWVSFSLKLGTNRPPQTLV